MTWRVDVGDCVHLMVAMPACSVDAVVCDPPYGLEFMGKEWDRLGDVGRASHQGFAEEKGFKGFRLASYGHSANVKCGRCRKWKWDHEGRKCECGPLAEWPNVKALEGGRMQEWHHRWAVEALRVLKPGGHLLAFGGTRTSHRLTCALEDAGFEIRDTLCWLYGSGFPKSLDVGKAIDKAAGAEREVIGRATYPDGVPIRSASPVSKHEGWQRPWMMEDEDTNARRLITAPATPDAERWDGWGTALKPAHEPIVVARKPLAGTVAANVLEHGTGALNVDGCRIGRQEGDRTDYGLENGAPAGIGYHGLDGRTPYDGSSGRWPANLLLDEAAAAMLDEQSGELTSGFLDRSRETEPNRIYGAPPKNRTGLYAPDSGGASRFFYIAKASRAERNAGLDGFEEQVVHDGRHTPISNPYLRAETERRNTHPTVKPVQLMRWLVRLVTPPEGLVLDPFTGSGTTGIAAVLEGFDFAGMEQDADYADIARARVGWWEQHGHDALRIVAEQEAAENEREAVRAAGQLELL